MSPKDVERASSYLLSVRRGQSRHADLLDDLRPTTIEHAYAIQDATVAGIGPVGGWKVGPIRGDAPPNCAPINHMLIERSPARFAMASVPGAEVEGEIAVTLGRDLPPRAELYSPEDLHAAIASVHPAIELCCSRYLDRKKASPLSVVADCQGNAAAVLGAGLAGWTGLDLSRIGMSLRIGGVEVATADRGFDVANMLSSLSWLANHAALRVGGLRMGDVVITGARIGPWPVGDAPTTIELDVTGLGRVSLDLDEPHQE